MLLKMENSREIRSRKVCMNYCGVVYYNLFVISYLYTFESFDKGVSSSLSHSDSLSFVLNPSGWSESSITDGEVCDKNAKNNHDFLVRYHTGYRLLLFSRSLQLYSHLPRNSLYAYEYAYTFSFHIMIYYGVIRRDKLNRLWNIAKWKWKFDCFFHRDEIPGLTTLLTLRRPDHSANCDAENSSSSRSFLPPGFPHQLYID